jgi:aspartate dehydrogenase
MNMDRNAPLRVGFLGYGTIGQDSFRLIKELALDEIEVVGALVRDPVMKRPPGPFLVTSLSALLDLHPDVIVEATGHDGLRQHGQLILRAGVDLILVSIGALADADFLQMLRQAAQENSAHIKIASGAIGGLDALSAASLGELRQVTHTLRKPPATLLPPQEAAKVHDAQEIFFGNARQAVRRFPEFLNVAAAVALAGSGFDETMVRVIADPTVAHSVHAFEAEGTGGTFHFTIENVPSRPPTRGARLVAMSIVYILIQRRQTLLIG